MARIADGGPPILVALVTNSGVGLLVLPNNRTVCILAAAFGDCVTGKGRFPLGADAGAWDKLVVPDDVSERQLQKTADILPLARVLSR